MSDDFWAARIGGTPAMGHMSEAGFWHSGRAEGCVKCQPSEPLPVFCCPRCGAESWNPNDVREGYCAACRDWTGRPEEGQR